MLAQCGRVLGLAPAVATRRGQTRGIIRTKGAALPCCACCGCRAKTRVSSSKPCQTRRRGPRRPVPGRKQGAAPSDMQNSKQHKLSSAVESRRPRAPIPATVGQECFTVRHTQRLGLSVRKNAHTPTSQWESRQTAAVGASTRAPHRARRRSHRHDLISGARRRPRHRRDLLSDAAAPRQATLI